MNRYHDGTRRPTNNKKKIEVNKTMNCEIAGCEEVARFHIDGFGYACVICKNEVVADLELDEEEEVRII